MKALLGCAAAVVTCLGAVHAQDVPAGFEEVGRFEITLDGSAETFVGAREVATGRSYFNVQNIAGMTAINVAGKSIAPGAGARIVSVLIGPFSGDVPATASFELYDGPDILAANVDTGSTISLSDVSLTDAGALSFSFAGQAVPVERDVNEGILKPLAGGAPVSVSGTFSGTLPEAE